MRSVYYLQVIVIYTLRIEFQIEIQALSLNSYLSYRASASEYFDVFGHATLNSAVLHKHVLDLGIKFLDISGRLTYSRFEITRKNDRSVVVIYFCVFEDVRSIVRIVVLVLFFVFIVLVDVFLRSKNDLVKRLLFGLFFDDSLFFERSLFGGEFLFLCNILFYRFFLKGGLFCLERLLFGNVFLYRFLFK